MIRLPYPIEDAAGRMVDAAIPTQCTPSRVERIAGFEVAQADLARLAVETVFGATRQEGIDHVSIVPLGVYATREALLSLAKTDRVDYCTAGKTADELQALSNFVGNRVNFADDDGRSLGFAAELGMANMLWAGIAEGQLNLNYGVLMGIRGLEKDHSGLRGDVDLLVRTNSSGKQARKKLQVKASSKRAQNIYEDGITVLTAQDIAGTSTPAEAVAKLLKWNRVDSNLKDRAYRKLEARLGMTINGNTNL